MKTILNKNGNFKNVSSIKTGEIMIFYPEDTVIPVTAILTVNY